MDVITQLFLLSVALIIGVGVAVAQFIALSRRYRSLCWWLYSAAFVVLAWIQVWGLLRLPIAIVQAKVAGQLPEALSAEIWIGVGVRFIFIGLIIAGNHINKRDIDHLLYDTGPYEELTDEKDVDQFVGREG